MKELALLILILMTGCASSREAITRTEFEEISNQLTPLSGYHRDYLGSDAKYHHIRIGTATGAREYLIPIAELPLRDPYPYSTDNIRLEPLLPKMKEDQMRSSDEAH